MHHHHGAPDSERYRRIKEYCSTKFEYFMERWGLLTMDLMRSPAKWRRWCGTLLGALAMWLMVLLMAYWWVLQVTKGAVRRILRRRR